MIGKIIKNISNIYIIKSNGTEYEAIARGKFKISDITPVVGDNVEFEVVHENQAVVNEILERKSYLKRPRVSNVSQIVFVISPKMPSTNFVMLDKGLCFAEFLGLNKIIVINKTDLDEKEADRIFKVYTKAGYKVIKMMAEEGRGLGDLKEALKFNTSVLSRKFWCTVNLLLQIKYLDIWLQILEK